MKIVSCHKADSKPVEQEVNSTVILPPFSVPCFSLHEIEEGALPDRPALDLVIEALEELDAGKGAAEGSLEHLQITKKTE